MPPTKRPRPVTVERARRLRGNMTSAEKVLWERLRMHRLDGLGFRRQHPAGANILDFYCSFAKLAVEVDGPHHDDDPDQAEHDRRRDAWLAREGIGVLRL